MPRPKVHVTRQQFELEFWSHVEQPDEGCWLWMKTKRMQNGFAYVWDRVAQKSRYAHHVAYEFAFGSLPAGMQISRVCGEQTCVRPAHLEAKVPSVMRATEWADGRRSGRKAHRVKTVLSAEVVLLLCQQRRDGQSLESLSEAFGISRQYANAIATGRARKEVAREPVFVRPNCSDSERLERHKAARNRYYGRTKPRWAEYRIPYYLENRERILAVQNERIVAFPERHRAIRANVKARRRGASGRHTQRQWEAIVAAQGGTCAICGELKPLTRDHIVSIFRGGTNDADNIQGLCGPCNSQKHTKSMEEAVLSANRKRMAVRARLPFAECASPAREKENRPGV